MSRELATRIGLGLASLGMLVALLSWVPSVRQVGGIIVPLIAGSVVYLAGGLLLAFNARGPEGKKAMNILRVIRLSFAAVAIVAIMQSARP